MCLICALPLTKAGHWTTVYLRETRVAVGWSAGGQPSDVTSFCLLLSAGVVSSEVGSVEEGSSVAFILISHRIHIKHFVKSCSHFSCKQGSRHICFNLTLPIVMGELRFAKTLLHPRIPREF
jgi:hypothetical protein